MGFQWKTSYTAKEMEEYKKAKETWVAERAKSVEVAAYEKELIEHLRAAADGQGQGKATMELFQAFVEKK